MLLRIIAILIFAQYSLAQVAMQGVSVQGIKVAPATAITAPTQFAGHPTTSTNLTSFLTSPSQPAALGTITDGLFGSTLTRLDNTPSDTVKVIPEYAKYQPWSVDGSKMLVYGETGGNWYVYNGTTYAYQKALTLTLDGIGTGDLRWANSRTEGICTSVNDTLYYRTGLIIKYHCAGTDVSTTKQTITSTGANYATWDDEGNQSDDDCKWVMYTANSSNFFVLDVVSVNICLGTQPATVSVATLSSAKDVRGTHQSINWVSVSASGTYAVVQWNDYGQTNGQGKGTDIFNFADLTFVCHVSDLNNHGDIGLDASGNDVFVMQGFTGLSSDYYTINSFKMSDCTHVDTVLPQPWQAPYGGTYHISMQGTRGASGLKGYALLSMYTADGTRAGTLSGGGAWGGDELVALQLGTNTWYRLGQEFNIKNTVDVAGCGFANCNYWQEPHATVNRNFTKILFGSDWLNSANPARAYVYALP